MEVDRRCGSCVCVVIACCFCCALVLGCVRVCCDGSNMTCVVVLVCGFVIGFMCFLLCVWFGVLCGCGDCVCCLIGWYDV